MKRVRSDFVGKKFGLMRRKFMAALAALSIASLSWMHLWLGIQMKVTEREMVDRVARRVWMHVTREWKECTFEMANRAGRGSVMIRKSWDRGAGRARKDFL